MLDETGNVIAQFKPLDDNLMDAPVAWESAADLRSAVDQRVRLRLNLKQATVYSFAFVE